MHAPMENSPKHTSPRTFGRRLGRPLKGQRQAALDRLPDFAIPEELLDHLPLPCHSGEGRNPVVLGDPGLRRDDSIKIPALDPRTLFNKPVDKIWFEIGFGSGEHLLARIAQSPGDGFIGAEPYINGMSAFLKELPSTPPPHVRVYMNDALHVIRSLSDKSLDGLYILNPDPWPKKRHHKRRIINPDNLDLFARVLKPGAHLIFSTDVAELAQWTQDHMNDRQDFEITEKSLINPYTPPPDWPLTTRYMAWGMSEGRKPHFLIYTRTPK